MSRGMLPAAIVCAVLWMAHASPKDAETPRQQEQTLTGAATWHVQMGGTLDEENTRDPISYDPWKQIFQPMRTVRMENTGDTDVVNPWVVVNGHRNWRTVADIVDDALRSYGDPAKMAPAEKARAIWEFLRRHRFHATTGDLEVRDPVKLLNVYGYALCGDNAAVLMDLWRAAGLVSRRGFPLGHCVNEVWYDGGWHLWDADESMIYLDRDNKNVVSEHKLAMDHEISWRAYRNTDWAAQFPYTGTLTGEFASHAEHKMWFTLHPGEALEWRWNRIPRIHRGGENALFGLDNTDLARWSGAPEDHSNGKLIYSPPLRTAGGAIGVEQRNIRWSQNTGEPAVSPEKANEPATLTWKIASPYVVVGGTLSATVRSGAGDSVVFRISSDGAAWKDIARIDKAGTAEVKQDLNAFFPQTGPPIYTYYVRAEIQSAGSTAGLDAITMDSDVQMAPLSLPGLRLGDNAISFLDETKEAHNVKVTFQWAEMQVERVPVAPSSPVFPAADAEAEGTAFTFRWAPAKVKGANIAAYELRLSDDAELRTALSPVFEPIVRMDASGRAEYAIPGEGLLTPGVRYYWKVRARSDEGIWGPWSATWSFVAVAPAVPVNVRIEQTGPDTYALAWDPGAGGRKPEEFEIYGSDERGFVPSAKPYEMPAGEQKSGTLFPGEKMHKFPANLVGKVKAGPFPLTPEHAWYRVVAVDAKGHRSGVSDYAAAPRPYIFSKPTLTVKAGTPFRYAARTVLSIGDLTYKDIGDPGTVTNSGYWNPDVPVFSLETELPRCGNLNPAWLTLDAKTGVLNGTPQEKDIGEYQINLKVEIPGAGAHIQSFPLTVTR